jgi:hypothetical protein
MGDKNAISVSYARMDDGQKKSGQKDTAGAAAAQQAKAQTAAAYSPAMGNISPTSAYTQYYAAQAAMIAPLMYGAMGLPGMSGMSSGQAALYSAYGMPFYTGYPMGYGMPGLESVDASAYSDPTAAAAMAAAAAAIMPQDAQAVESPTASQTHEETKLFVGGLPTNVTEAEIRMVFGQLGTVKEVHIMQGRSQSGQACAFVVYPDVYSSQLAIRTLNKTPWHAAPDQPPIIVRAADKVIGKKTRSKGPKNKTGSA